MFTKYCWACQIISSLCITVVCLHAIKMLISCANRWFKDDVDNLRWKCPHHPDMSLPAGDKGQDMPSYGAIDLAKYGKRVLLERIVRLLLAVKLSEHGWLQAYVDATRSLHGELPLCKSAIECLEALLVCASSDCRWSVLQAAHVQSVLYVIILSLSGA